MNMNNFCKTKKRQQAITLIEVLVTVTIIAILASLANYSYVTFKTKARIQEAIKTLEEYKIISMNLYAKNGILPNASQILSLIGNTANNNIALDLKYVNRIYASTNNVTSTITLSVQLNDAFKITSSNNRLYYRGSRQTNGAFLWVCGVTGSNGLDTELRPSNCQNSF